MLGAKSYLLCWISENRRTIRQSSMYASPIYAVFFPSSSHFHPDGTNRETSSTRQASMSHESNCVFRIYFLCLQVSRDLGQTNHQAWA
jgi:hypothetical protein